MTETRITREEAEALSSGRSRGGAAAHGVRPRDFREPRRLSGETLNLFRITLTDRLSGLTAALRSWLGKPLVVELEDVSETRYETLLASVIDGSRTSKSPLCTGRFEVEGRPGWVIWESEPARKTVELALGVGGTAEDESSGAPADEEPVDDVRTQRELSFLEAGLTAEILGVFVRELLGAFGLSPAGFELFQRGDALQLSIEKDGLAGVDESASDSQRIFFRVRFETAGVESTLRLLVPGLGAVAGPPHATEPKTLPQHLGTIPMEMSVILDTIDVPLSALLGLEPGDVVPLGARAGDPVRVFIEERECARARLGTFEGQLAVRLEDDVKVHRTAPPAVRRNGA